MDPTRYQRGYRRTLLDMHIPDWDPAFLSQYDPRALADLYVTARVSSVMMYCESHVGLCYWPAPAGKMHDGLHGRDVVGELLGHLRARSIDVCAYHTTVFDNWAAETHPDWQIVPAQSLGGHDWHLLGPRYGVLCPNNPKYRAYERAQIGGLIERYRFDGLFIDMAFFPGVCVCRHCRERFRAETGDEIPRYVDWLSPGLGAFQAARIRWLAEFFRGLAELARTVQPGIAVYHNLAPALLDWTTAQSIADSRYDTFVGGDLYGGRGEQLFVSKLLVHLSETQPAEFMTSRAVNLKDHVSLKSEHELQTQALAAIAHSCAFLFIDAIDPRGTVNPAVYEQMGRIYQRTAQFEPYLGGEPIEDIAVYFSDDSKMDFAQNGMLLQDLGPSANRYPHVTAAIGACTYLQRAHLPFAVITRRQIADLQRYRVLVLPNVLRLDADEVAAFRAYVQQGGRLLASGYSSLVDTLEGRRSTFALADVFGCDVEGDETGLMVYLKPLDPAIAAAVYPQDYLCHVVRPDSSFNPGERPSATSVPRLRPSPRATVLASLSLAYAYPAEGTLADHRFASIHASPPWEDTDRPVIVQAGYGAGSAIYSAAPIEAASSAVNERVFVHLVRRLLDGTPSLSAVTHPSVWITGFHQPEQNRVVVNALVYQEEDLPVPVGLQCTVQPPAGTSLVRALRVPDMSPLPSARAADGSLEVDCGMVSDFVMFLVEYEPRPV